MKYLIELFFVFFVFCASAQKQADFSEIRIAPYFSTDFNTYSNNSLNDYLINRNYFTSSNILSNLSVGFSLRSINNPSIFAVSFCRGASLIEEPGNNSLLESNGIRFEFLWDLIKNEKWLIAPCIGVKSSNYKFIAVSRDVFSPLTGNNLEECAQMLSKNIFSAGFQFDRQISIRFVNIHLGFQTFYNLNIGDNSWYGSNQQRLANMPTINLSGVSLGFYSRIELNPFKIQTKK